MLELISISLLVLLVLLQFIEFWDFSFFMNILVVQESDWIKRNPHQQHHLMERLAERGHCVHVIDYPIDWSLEKDGGLINNEERVCGYSKIIDGVDITVTRPSFIRIKGLNYLSMIYTHKKAIKDEVQDFKPDVIVGLGLLNTYAASKIAQKNNIPFIYYVIDNLYALIPEKPLQIFGKKVFKIDTEKCIKCGKCKESCKFGAIHV